MYPEKFEKLIEIFRKLPGVGSKTAERYAFEILEYSDEEVEEFMNVLYDVKHSITHCIKCGHITDDNLCGICKDDSRDQTTICVVQEPKDVIAMEKIHEYRGLYHVLHGVINTSKGILPDDINIASLLDRVNDQIKEVIVATNPTVEGETTALYLSKLLEPSQVKVTRIAHGLPMGGHLDYADELTLIKALEGRKKI